MANLLRILRDYTINKKEILEKGDIVTFGELSWPKSARTPYLRDPKRPLGQKEYYTLESFLFLLNNMNLSHPHYTNESKARNIPHILRPHRKEVIDFLTGKIDAAKGIDPKGPEDPPIAVKREAEDDLSGNEETKKPRLEELEVKQEVPSPNERTKIPNHTADLNQNLSLKAELCCDYEKLEQASGGVCNKDVIPSIAYSTTVRSQRGLSPAITESTGRHSLQRKCHGNIIKEKVIEGLTREKRSLFVCDKCDHTSVNSAHMNSHMKTHTGEKPYACEECNYRSVTRHGLIYHMRTHTGEKPFACNICDFKCAQSSTLISHMRTHSGVKPYSCDFCEYESSTKGTLNVHIRSHTGEKPFACYYCDFKTVRSTVLKKHVLRIHTTKKSVRCDYCDYKSKESDTMRKHVMRKHSGKTLGKHIGCELCDFRCTSVYYLKSHMNTHSDDRPFACTICDHKSRRAGDLNVHMKAIHAVKDNKSAAYRTESLDQAGNTVKIEPEEKNGHAR